MIDIVAKAISGIDIGFGSQKRKGIWMEVLRFIAEITAAPGPLRGGPTFLELCIVQTFGWPFFKTNTAGF